MSFRVVAKDSKQPVTRMRIKTGNNGPNDLMSIPTNIGGGSK